MVYGDEEIAEPILVPSTLNCTFEIEPLPSEAVAVRVTEDPETVEFADGAVREAEGPEKKSEALREEFGQM